MTIHEKRNLQTLDQVDTVLTPVYASRELNTAVPKFEIPEQEMSPRIAYTMEALPITSIVRWTFRVCHCLCPCRVSAEAPVFANRTLHRER